MRQLKKMRIVCVLVAVLAGAMGERAARGEVVVEVAPNTLTNSLLNSYSANDEPVRFVLSEGTYSNALYVGNYITPLTIEAAPGAAVVFTPPQNFRSFNIFEMGRSITIRGVQFVGANRAGGSLTLGGAIRVSLCLDVRFVDCAFIDNSMFSPGGGAGGSSTIVGGAIAVEQSAVRFERCVFEGNSLNYGGATDGIVQRSLLGGALFASGSYLQLVGCDFLENSAAATASQAGANSMVETRGGAIYALQSRVTVDRCRFIGNLSAASLPSGAGRIANAFGGAAYALHDSSQPLEFIVLSSLLAGNAATGTTEGSGGAICSSISIPANVVNCTLADNHCTHKGGAIFSLGAGVRLGNSIVAGNTTSGGGPDLNGDNLHSLGHNLFTSPNQQVFQGAAADDLLGAHPLFIDAPSGDYRIAFGSPAIDRGDTGLLMQFGATLDVFGAPRAIDDPFTPNLGVVLLMPTGHIGAVDIGAHEFQRAPCPGDVNGDGLVNAQDLAQVLGGWGVCQ